MDLHKKTFTTSLGGEEIKMEISDLAGQTNAAVMGHYGNTVVLATVVMSKTNKGGDFFPLTVDYEERFYAAGKIMGSRFVRRENRPSDEAVLSGRLVDRTIRPLFDSRLRREVQLVITVLSYDEEHEPDVAALLTASVALAISDIPWKGPVAGVQYAEKNADGKERVKAFFAGPKGRVNMIEMSGKEIAESEAEALFDRAEKDIEGLISFQNKIVGEIGKPKTAVATSEPDAEFVKKIAPFIDGKIDGAIK